MAKKVDKYAIDWALYDPSTATAHVQYRLLDLTLESVDDVEYVVSVVQQGARRITFKGIRNAAAYKKLLRDLRSGNHPIDKKHA